MSKNQPGTDSSDSSPSCRIVYWPLCAMIALALLRLAIGWHFFSEGTKKLSYNPTTGERTIEVPSEMLFGRAVGPLAPYFKSKLPGFHNWEELFAQPKKLEKPTDEQKAAAAKWQDEYQRAQQAALKEGKIPEAQFPPDAPYTAWAEQVVEDWRGVLARVVAVNGLSEEERGTAAQRLERRQLELADYLAGESADIADWRHQLWRLEQMEETHGGEAIPYRKERITEKRGETQADGRLWVNQVQDIQRSLYEDWRNVPPAEDRIENPAVYTRINTELEDPQERKLNKMNWAVTYLIIGVGVLLMLGLFTRLAAAAGCVFLLTVMATQPPWVAGASTQFFYYQLVEVAALLVLIATAAGRFGGLDFFLSRCCGTKVKS